MFELNRANLIAGKLNAAVSPATRQAPIRILQIGDGNFLRAFVDWMVDVANGAGVFNGEVIMVQPLERGIAKLMRTQDHLFTVLLRGVQDGQEIRSKRLITCVKDTLNPTTQWNTLLACMADPALRFVVSNTTEAGIAYTPEAQPEGRSPVSFPAKITALLLARFLTRGGTAASDLVFLPCELIEANGSKLRAHVLQIAADWQLPATFIAWVETHNTFCNTLVDRIVPGFPAVEATSLYAEFGYRDPLLVAAEPFLLWVIEGPAHLADSLPLHRAGLEVIWTDDLQPYRTRKVRILNGAHTASALAAFCAGLDTVQEMTTDPLISRYLQMVMFQEIVPFVPLPEAERRRYAESIMERFANPHIRHELISISLNSVSKWKVRILPTLKDYVSQYDQAPTGLSFSLAALIYFYRGQFVGRDDYIGQRQEQSYPIRDNADILARLHAAWQQAATPAELTGRLLADDTLWGEDLTGLADLAAQTARQLSSIQANGIKAALRELLEKQ